MNIRCASVPSKCKTRRELGCDPVRCNASRASPETTKVMHFQERLTSQRTTTQPLPLEGASRHFIRKILAAQEPLFVQAICCHCQFLWRFLLSLYSFSLGPPHPLLPTSHYFFSYADYILKLNLWFNNFTTSKFSLCQFLSFMYLTLLVSSTF